RQRAPVVRALDRVGAVFQVQVGVAPVAGAEIHGHAAAHAQHVPELEIRGAADPRVADVSQPVHAAVRLDQADTDFHVRGAGAQALVLVARWCLEAQQADYPRAGFGGGAQVVLALDHDVAKPRFRARVAFAGDEYRLAADEANVCGTIDAQVGHAELQFDAGQVPARSQVHQVHRRVFVQAVIAGEPSRARVQEPGETPVVLQFVR